MTLTEYRKLVKEMVNDSTGIKAIELATKVAIAVHEAGPQATKYDIWEDALDPLIASGEIVELEYLLKDSDWRIKSIFFPEGTKFQKGGNND